MCSSLSQLSPNCPSYPCSRNFYKMICKRHVQRKAWQTRMSLTCSCELTLPALRPACRPVPPPTVKASFNFLAEDVTNLFSLIILVCHLYYPPFNGFYIFMYITYMRTHTVSWKYLHTLFSIRFYLILFHFIHNTSGALVWPCQPIWRGLDLSQHTRWFESVMNGQPGAYWWEVQTDAASYVGPSHSPGSDSWN